MQRSKIETLSKEEVSPINEYQPVISHQTLLDKQRMTRNRTGNNQQSMVTHSFSIENQVLGRNSIRVRQARSQSNIHLQRSSFDLGFSLPTNLKQDTIIRTERSHFPGSEVDNRFKELIIKAFATPENDSLLKVSQYIANNSLITHYPKGSRFKTTQLCAILEKDKFLYDERYKTENKGNYLEYQLNDRSLCVIKHTYQESQIERDSTSYVMKGLKS